MHASRRRPPNSPTLAAAERCVVGTHVGRSLSNPFVLSPGASQANSLREPRSHHEREFKWIRQRAPKDCSVCPEGLFGVPEVVYGYLEATLRCDREVFSRYAERTLRCARGALWVPRRTLRCARGALWVPRRTLRCPRGALWVRRRTLRCNRSVLSVHRRDSSVCLGRCSLGTPKDSSV